MKIKRTPTPWFYDHERGHIYADPGFLVVSLSDYEKADAEFIVRAVNNHAALLEAVKAALKGLDQLESADGWLGDQLREAIAKAEGK